MIKTVVLYHRGCNDGIVAAWAAWKVFGDVAEYIPYQYGEELPVEVWGSNLIMVDLSLKAEQLSQVRSEVASILIIDHHKSALPLLNHMEPVKTYREYVRKRSDMSAAMIMFNQSYSGAVLAWAFFNDITDIESADMPYALKLIQDYDLWEHKYPQTRPVNAWLLNLRPSIKRVDTLMTASQHELDAIILSGENMLVYDANIVRGVATGHGYLQVIQHEDKKIALINGPHHLRNALADWVIDEFDAVVVYTERAQRTVYSLRSPKRMDVAAFAERFGGGGHKDSAAFSIKHSKLHTLLLRAPFYKLTLKERLVAGLRLIFKGA